MSGLLYASTRIVQVIVRDGHGDEYLPLHAGSVLVPYHGLLLAARPYQNEHFTYKQILDAIDLLRLCGLDRGYREEMWAYCFLGPKRIGEISIQWARVSSSSNENRTSAMENS